jgi:hypothetical protein
MVLPTLRNSGSHSCRFCLLSLLLYSVVIVHLGHSFLIPLSSNNIGLLQRQQQQRQQQRGQGRSTRQQLMKSSSRRYSMAGGAWSSNTTSSTSSASTSTSSYEISRGSAETLQPPDRQRRSSASTTTTTATTAPFIQGPPRDTKPDYGNIHGPMGKMVDQILLRIFRSRMAEHIGVDSKLPQVSTTTTMNQIERQILEGWPTRYNPETTLSVLYPWIGPFVLVGSLKSFILFLILRLICFFFMFSQSALVSFYRTGII